MKGLLFVAIFLSCLCEKTKFEYTSGAQKTTELNYFDTIAGDGGESNTISI